MNLRDRDGFIEELTRLIVKNEFSDVKYDVDIYLYVNRSGRWRFFEFKNYTGNRCFNDNHLTVWTIKRGTDGDVFFRKIEERTGKRTGAEERRDRMREFYKEYFEEYLEKIIFFENLGMSVEWI